MFWSNKNNKDKRQKSGNNKGVKESQKASGCAGGSPKGSKGKSQRIREEALANAQKAREAIGEDTLDKIAEMFAKKQNSAMQKAKDAADSDPDKALDELLFMLKSRD